MREVVIVDGVRVPIGKAGKDKGYYKDIRADDLGAMCIRRLLEKNPKLDPKEIEDVVWGCANQTGEQGLNVGRMIGLLSGLPVEVAGTTIDRQCGSSLQAVNFAAQEIMTGAGEVAIAGGVEHMTHVAMGSGILPNPKLLEMFPRDMFFMGMTAERLAEMYKITREQSDAFSLRSNMRAVAARERFKEEIVPVKLPDGAVVDVDQGPRAETTMEKLAGLKPSFKPDGQVTAGNSSQLSDGAAAVLLMSAERATRARRETDGEDSRDRGRRRPSGNHGMGSGALDAQSAGARRTENRRYRPVRNQRGFRRAGARVQHRSQDRRGAAQREWRRDRTRASARMLGRAAGRDADA